MDKKNLAIVRQSFAQTVFTHQVQESAANRNTRYSKNIKIINIVTVAIVLILVLLQSIFPQSNFLNFIALGVSIFEIMFLMVQLNFNFEDRASSHKMSALEYMGIRDEYRMLITDIMSGSLEKGVLVEKRNSLQNKYQQVSKMSPTTTSRDFASAQLSLNNKIVQGEQFTWSDKDIDRFLPEDLRIYK